MRAGLLFQLLVAAYAVVQAARYGRRALRFVLPGARAVAAPEAGGSPRRLRLGAELEALGFAPLGTWEERGALGARLSLADAYASPELGAYADVVTVPGQERVETVFLNPVGSGGATLASAFARRSGPGGAGVSFFTPFADGAAVLTAAFARPALVSDRVQAGGMDGAPLPAVLAAHQVAVRRFAATSGAPAVVPALEARLAAADAWDRAAGRAERRRANALAFGIVLVAVALLAGVARALWRA